MKITAKNLVNIIAKLIAAGMLIWALDRHQYDYYTVLRWVVCGVAAFAAAQAAKSDKSGWAWSLGIAALVLNPLIPVHLKRDTWAVIDIAVAVLLVLSIVALDRRTPPPVPPAPTTPVEHD